MIDVSKTIAPKSDQLNADDLIGGPLVITVMSVKEVGGDQPIAIHFQGDNGKPYKPCKSMRRVLVKVWGKDGATYVGQSMMLYSDPNVSFGGSAVGGIRISHMSNISAPVKMALTVSRARRAQYNVEPLNVEQAASQDHSDIDDMSEKAASCGTEAYRKWFGEQDRDQQLSLTQSGLHDKNKQRAKEVDIQEGANG